jgi:REP element-mobilizing transposase RayT
MSLYKHKYRIETTRLKNWDYSNIGYYFVTNCIHEHKCILGHIQDDFMILNNNGSIVSTCLDNLRDYYPNMLVDQYVVMPNHVHMIIFIHTSPSETGWKPVSTDRIKYHGLSEIVRGFKTYTSKNINKLRGTKGTPVWQKRFYERVIRDEKQLNSIREYVYYNVLNWNKDELFRA